MSYFPCLSTQSKILLDSTCSNMKIFLLLLFVIIARVSATATTVSLAKPGCPDSCGDVVIPYPFGIGSGCYLNEWFSITCSETHGSGRRTFLSRYNVQVYDISLQERTLHINRTVIRTSPIGNGSARSRGVTLGGENPYFSYSSTKNVFVVWGCDVVATVSQDKGIVAGCISICSTDIGSSGCFGTQGCCQTMIPPEMNNYTLTVRRQRGANHYGMDGTAFIVDNHWLQQLHIETLGNLYYPLALDWKIMANETCQSPKLMKPKSGVYLCSNNIYCSISDTGFAEKCSCPKGFQGNPYLPQGCEDIDECLNATQNHCTNTCYGGSISNNTECKTCINILGSYKCSCPLGYLGDANIHGNGCFILSDKSQVSTAIFIGIIASFGILFLVVGAWWFYKLIKTRKEIKLKQFFFKRNGGPILQQQLCTKDGNLAKCKLFITSKELEIATDNFNENRILGRGGQGIVYKGMLSNGRIVAIKKLKLATEGKVDQFVNEVAILSQINHRNVVKLLGCCLETEAPLLVYEFIPNGTLSNLIQSQNEDFPVSWLMRLRIATETARAILYLHSAASFPIYHGDIKSSNILLDEKYRAKVSDFGTSRSVSLDQTHFTTQVKGTFGYLDPEFYKSSRLTEKSDVYGFGVILVELLTGQKPVIFVIGLEERSLAEYFLMSMEENRVLDILDPQVAKEEKKQEEVMAVADLARRCLNMSGRNRPSMQEVAVELEGIIYQN